MDKLHVLEELKNYRQNKPIRLHMPGHKGILPDEFLSVAELDVTELNNIKIVQAVKQAETDIAKIYGANYCKLISNGSTGGILSMVHAVKGLGDKIIINRTAHQSVYNAIELCDLEPIILDKPTVEETKKALEDNQSVIGALFTYPDYFGEKFDIKGVKTLLKKQGKLLLVDNAHGAHVKFTDTEAYAGAFADAWVDSAHKTLPSLNQGAMLFCSNAKLIDLIDSSIKIFATTSPSYPILASIEYGVKYMAHSWKDIRQTFLSWRSDFKTLVELLGIKVKDYGDVFKLTLDFSPLGVNAFDIEKGLNENGVYPELTDSNNVLLMFSIQTAKTEFNKTYNAIKRTLDSVKQRKQKDTEEDIESLLAERVMPYLTAIKSGFEYVKLKNAIGKVCAVNTGVFPPCYPVLTAGEKITAKAVEILKNSEYTFGLNDGRIKVVKE